jgi:hypothetical protein
MGWNGRLRMNVWWRFKGDREWFYGYKTIVEGGLWRMGKWHGDTSRGIIVSPEEVEIKEWN